MFKKLSQHLIFAIALFSFAVAQAEYVGIKSAQANFFAAEQQNSNWCWAASIKMVLKKYDIKIEQSQIVARTYGLDPNGPLPNWTGDEAAITNNLNNWNIDNSGQPYQVKALMFLGAPTPKVLIDELKNGHPVLVGYQSGPSSAHAVVITAVNYEMSPIGPIIISVVARDPWPSPENIANQGRVEYVGANFANVIRSYWYIRVNKINPPTSALRNEPAEVAQPKQKAHIETKSEDVRDSDEKVVSEESLKRQEEIVTTIKTQNLLGVGKANNPTASFINNCHLEMKWRWKNTFFGTPDNKRDTTERVSIHFDENISFVVPTYVDEGQIQLDMRNISYENKTKWVKHYNSLNEDDATHRNAGSLPAHYNPDAGSNIMTKFDRDYVIDLLNELVSVCQ